MLFILNFWNPTKLLSSNLWHMSLVFQLTLLIENSQALFQQEDFHVKLTKSTESSKLTPLIKEINTTKTPSRKVIISSIKFKNFQELSMFDLYCFDLMQIYFPSLKIKIKKHKKMIEIYYPKVSFLFRL